MDERPQSRESAGLPNSPPRRTKEDRPDPKKVFPTGRRPKPRRYDFTPPTSPHAGSNSFSQRHGGNRPPNVPPLKTDTASTEIRTPTRGKYSPFPSPVSNISPPLPDALPPPHLPLKAKDSILVRQHGRTGALPSPLKGGFDRPEPSPTLSTRSGRSRNSRNASDSRTFKYGPLSSNPVTNSWRESKEDVPWITQYRARGHTDSGAQPAVHPIAKLRTATSIPDYAPYRAPAARAPSSTYRPARGQTERSRRPVRDSSEGKSSLRREPYHPPDEARSSFRSGWTNTSSGFLDASGTERSSILTGESLGSDNRESLMEKQESRERETEDTGEIQMEEEGEGETDDNAEVMSVEDAIDMYASGFDDAPLTRQSTEMTADEGYNTQSMVTSSPESSALPDMPGEPEIPPLPENPIRQRRHSASRLERSSTFLMSTMVTDAKPSVEPIKTSDLDLPAPPKPNSPTQLLSPRTPVIAQPPAPVPRDRYGFKKATSNITVAEYDAWEGQYCDYLERRRQKWELLMKKEGLPYTDPNRFPQKSDKVKRYVRKGIPPAWRGAAWFYYAGGDVELATQAGLYWKLVARIDKGELPESESEIIERDLHRTFPDNIRFKPDYVSTPTSSPVDAQETPEETPIIKSLRRVLKAFALHYPNIGYCQSMNFLAGLLLLFLKQDEEKAFVMLTIITTVHLPGMHSRILEANVDMGILMSYVRETMPAVYSKIDDVAALSSIGPGSSARLPTISLTTTSWFMSLFVGNLPIETVLRVWDILFYEGSKTLFRISLALIKSEEQAIRSLGDQMEVFTLIQGIPRKMIDPNGLLEACYKRRGGFGHIKQGAIDSRRKERRKKHQQEIRAQTDKLAPRPNAGVKPAEGQRSATMKFKRSLSKRGRRA